MKSENLATPQVIKILDHGFVKLIDVMGSDQSIIEAARESTDKGFLGWGPICAKCDKKIEYMADRCGWCGNGTYKGGDEKLLTYLYENRHDTPFEMAEMIIQVQAPIFIFREWHRHRTQSYNEMSARYTPMPDVNYKPSVERCLMVSGQNRQAGRAEGAGELTHEKAIHWLERVGETYALSQAVYQEGLDLGIPKEIARIPVPVGRYSRMRAKANLRNWLGFLTLRADQAAMWELRQYAYAVGYILSKEFPRTWDLFLNHDRRRAVIDKNGFLSVKAA
jgi:thymidylate synthase (FAD)